MSFSNEIKENGCTIFISNKDNKTNQSVYKLLDHLLKNRRSLINDSVIPQTRVMGPNDADLAHYIISVIKVDQPNIEPKYPILLKNTNRGVKFICQGINEVTNFFKRQISSGGEGFKSNTMQVQDLLSKSIYEGMKQVKDQKTGNSRWVEDDTETALGSKEDVTKNYQEKMEAFKKGQKSNMPDEATLKDRAANNKLLMAMKEGDQKSLEGVDDILAQRGNFAQKSTTFGNGDDSANNDTGSSFLDSYLRSEAAIF